MVEQYYFSHFMDNIFVVAACTAGKGTVFCKLLVIVHSKWALSIVLLWLLDLIRNVLTHNFLYVL